MQSPAPRSPNCPRAPVPPTDMQQREQTSQSNTTGAPTFPINRLSNGTATVVAVASIDSVHPVSNTTFKQVTVDEPTTSCNPYHQTVSGCLKRRPDRPCCHLRSAEHKLPRRLRRRTYSDPTTRRAYQSLGINDPRQSRTLCVKCITSRPRTGDTQLLALTKSDKNQHIFPPKSNARFIDGLVDWVRGLFSASTSRVNSPVDDKLRLPNEVSSRPQPKDRNVLLLPSPINTHPNDIIGSSVSSLLPDLSSPADVSLNRHLPDDGNEPTNSIFSSTVDSLHTYCTAGQVSVPGSAYYTARDFTKSTQDLEERQRNTTSTQDEMEAAQASELLQGETPTGFCRLQTGLSCRMSEIDNILTEASAYPDATFREYESTPTALAERPDLTMDVCTKWVEDQQPRRILVTNISEDEYIDEKFGHENYEHGLDKEMTNEIVENFTAEQTVAGIVDHGQYTLKRFDAQRMPRLKADDNIQQSDQSTFRIGQRSTENRGSKTRETLSRAPEEFNPGSPGGSPLPVTQENDDNCLCPVIKIQTTFEWDIANEEGHADDMANPVVSTEVDSQNRQASSFHVSIDTSITGSDHRFNVTVPSVKETEFNNPMNDNMEPLDPSSIQSIIIDGEIKVEVTAAAADIQSMSHTEVRLRQYTPLHSPPFSPTKMRLAIITETHVGEVGTRSLSPNSVRLALEAPSRQPGMNESIEQQACCEEAHFDYGSITLLSATSEGEAKEDYVVTFDKDQRSPIPEDTKVSMQDEDDYGQAIHYNTVTVVADEFIPTGGRDRRRESVEDVLEEGLVLEEEEALKMVCSPLRGSEAATVGQVQAPSPFTTQPFEGPREQTAVIPKRISHPVMSGGCDTISATEQAFQEEPNPLLGLPSRYSGEVASTRRIDNHLVKIQSYSAAEVIGSDLSEIDEGPSKLQTIQDGIIPIPEVSNKSLSEDIHIDYEPYQEEIIPPAVLAEKPTPDAELLCEDGQLEPLEMSAVEEVLDNDLLSEMEETSVMSGTKSSITNETADHRPQEVAVSGELSLKPLLEVEILEQTEDRATIMANEDVSVTARDLEQLEAERQPYQEDSWQLIKPLESGAPMDHQKSLDGEEVNLPSITVPEAVKMPDTQTQYLQIPVDQSIKKPQDIAATHSVPIQKQLQTEPFEGLKSRFTVTPTETLLLQEGGFKHMVHEQQPYQDEPFPLSMASREQLSSSAEVEKQTGIIQQTMDSTVPEEVIQARPETHPDKTLEPEISTFENNALEIQDVVRASDELVAPKIETKQSSKLSEQQISRDEQGCRKQATPEAIFASGFDLTAEHAQANGTIREVNATEQQQQLDTEDTALPECKKPEEMWLTVSSQREPDNMAHKESVRVSSEQPLRVLLTDELEVGGCPVELTNDLEQFTQTRVEGDLNICVESFHDELTSDSSHENVAVTISPSEKFESPHKQQVNVQVDTGREEVENPIEVFACNSPIAPDNMTVDIQADIETFTYGERIDSPGLSVKIASTMLLRPETPANRSSVKVNTTVNLSVSASPTNLSSRELPDDMEVTRWARDDSWQFDNFTTSTPVKERYVNKEIPDHSVDSREKMERRRTPSPKPQPNSYSPETVIAFKVEQNPVKSSEVHLTRRESDNMERLVWCQPEALDREEKKKKIKNLPGDLSTITSFPMIDQPAQSGAERTEEISSYQIDINTSLLPEHGSNTSIRTDNNTEFDQLIPVDVPEFTYMAKWSDGANEAATNTGGSERLLPDRVSDISTTRLEIITTTKGEKQHDNETTVKEERCVITVVTSTTPTTDASGQEGELSKSDDLDHSSKLGEPIEVEPDSKLNAALHELAAEGELIGKLDREASGEIVLLEGSSLLNDPTVINHQMKEGICQCNTLATELIKPTVADSFEVDLNQPVTLTILSEPSKSIDKLKCHMFQDESLWPGEPTILQPVPESSTEETEQQTDTQMPTEKRSRFSPYGRATGRKPVLVEISWNVKYLSSPEVPAEDIRHPEVQVRYEAQLTQVEESKLTNEMTVILKDDEFGSRDIESKDDFKLVSKNKDSASEPFDTDMLSRNGYKYATDATDKTELEQVAYTDNLQYLQYDNEICHFLDNTEVKRPSPRTLEYNHLPRKLITLPLGEIPSLSDTQSFGAKTRRPDAAHKKQKRLYCGETASTDSVHGSSRDINKLHSYVLPPTYQKHVPERADRHEAKRDDFASLPCNLSLYLSQPTGLDEPKMAEDENEENIWLSEASIVDATRPGSSISLPNYGELSEMKTPLVFRKHYKRPCNCDRTESREGLTDSSTAPRPSSPFDWSHASTMFPDYSNTPVSSDSALPTSPTGIRLAQSATLPMRQKHSRREKASPNNNLLDEPCASRGFCNSNLPQYAQIQDTYEQPRSQSCPRSQIGQVQITISQRICRCGRRSGTGGSSTEVNSPIPSCISSPPLASATIWSPGQMRLEADADMDIEQIKRESRRLSQLAIFKAVTSLAGNKHPNYDRPQDGEPTAVGRVEQVGMYCIANVAASVDVRSEVRSPITVSMSTKTEERVQPSPTSSALAIQATGGGEARALPVPHHLTDLLIRANLSPTKLQSTSQDLPASMTETDFGVFSFSSTSQQNGIEISTKIDVHLMKNGDVGVMKQKALPGRSTSPKLDQKTPVVSPTGPNQTELNNEGSYEDAVQLIEDQAWQISASSDMKTLAKESLIVTPPISPVDVPMVSPILLQRNEQDEPYSTLEETLKADDSDQQHRHSFHGERSGSGEPCSNIVVKTDDQSMGEVKETENELQRASTAHTSSRDLDDKSREEDGENIHDQFEQGRPEDPKTTENEQSSTVPWSNLKIAPGDQSAKHLDPGVLEIHFISDLKLTEVIPGQVDEISKLTALEVAPSIEINTEAFIQHEDGTRISIEHTDRTVKLLQESTTQEYSGYPSFKHTVVSNPVTVGDDGLEVVQEWNITYDTGRSNQAEQLTPDVHEATLIPQYVTAHVVVKVADQETKTVNVLPMKLDTGQDVPSEQNKGLEASISGVSEASKTTTVLSASGYEEKPERTLGVEPSEVARVSSEDVIESRISSENELGSCTGIESPAGEIKAQGSINLEELQICEREQTDGEEIMDSGAVLLVTDESAELESPLSAPDEQLPAAIIAHETPKVGQQETADSNEVVDYQKKALDIDEEKEHQQVFITTPPEREGSTPSAMEIVAETAEQQTRMEDSEVASLKQEVNAAVESTTSYGLEETPVTQIQPVGQATEEAQSSRADEVTEKNVTTDDRANQLAQTDEVEETVVPVESDITRVPSQSGLAKDDIVKESSEYETFQPLITTKVEVETGEHLAESSPDSPSALQPEREANLAETTECLLPADNLTESRQDSKVGERSEVAGMQSPESLSSLAPLEDAKNLIRETQKTLDETLGEKTLHFISEVKIVGEILPLDENEEQTDEREVIVAPSIEVNTETYITTSTGVRVPVDNAGQYTQMEGGLEESSEHPDYLTFKHYVTPGPIIVDGKEVEIVQEVNILIDMSETNSITLLNVNHEKAPQAITTHVTVKFAEQHSLLNATERGATPGEVGEYASEQETAIKVALADMIEAPSTNAVNIIADEPLDGRAEIQEQPVGRIAEQAQEIYRSESPSRLLDDSKLDQQASTEMAADTLAAAETIPFTETTKTGQLDAPDDIKGEMTEGVGGEPTGLVVSESDIIKPDEMVPDERSVTEAADLLVPDVEDDLPQADVYFVQVEEQQVDEIPLTKSTDAQKLIAEITITMKPGEPPKVTVHTIPSAVSEQTEVIRNQQAELPHTSDVQENVGEVHSDQFMGEEIPITIPILDVRSSEENANEDIKQAIVQPSQLSTEASDEDPVLGHTAEHARQPENTTEIEKPGEANLAGTDETPLARDNVIEIIQDGNVGEQAEMPETSEPTDREPDEGKLAETVGALRPESSLSYLQEDAKVGEQAEVSDSSAPIEIKPQQIDSLVELFEDVSEKDMERVPQTGQLMYHAEDKMDDINEQNEVTSPPSPIPVFNLTEFTTEIIVTLEPGQQPQITINTVLVRTAEEEKQSKVTEQVTADELALDEDAARLKLTEVPSDGRGQANEEISAILMDGTTESGLAHTEDQQITGLQEYTEEERVVSAPETHGYQTTPIDEEGVNPPAEGELPLPTMTPEANELRRSQGMVTGLKDINAQDSIQLGSIEPVAQYAKTTSREVIDADQVTTQGPQDKNSDVMGENPVTIGEDSPSLEEVLPSGPPLKTKSTGTTDEEGLEDIPGVRVTEAATRELRGPVDETKAELVSKLTMESEMKLEYGQTDDELPRGSSFMESTSRFEFRPVTGELEKTQDNDVLQHMEADTTVFGLMPGTLEESTFAESHKQTDTHLPDTTVTIRPDVRAAGEVSTHYRFSRDYTEPTAFSTEPRSMKRGIRTEEDSDSLDRHFVAMINAPIQRPVSFMDSMKQYCMRKKAGRQEEKRSEKGGKVATALDALIQETILSLKRRVGEA